MSMMMTQILKFLDSLKTEKAKYLEKESLFSVQERKFIHRAFKAVL